MRAWLIYEESEAHRNRHYIQLYFDQAKEWGIELSLLIDESIEFGFSDNHAFLRHKGNLLPPPDFAVCRTRRPLLSRHMEHMGIAVFNNAKVSDICNDKRKTYQLAAAKGIPIADTVLYNGQYYGTFPYPLVIKPACGHGGQGVKLVHNEEDFKDAVAGTNPDDLVLQRLAKDVGKDLRVYVIGKRIVACILRTSEMDFRSNYSLGGTPSVYNLSQDEKALVEKVISLFDFGLVGIDFVFDGGRMLLNEIEDVVGSRMLYAITQIDIVKEYFDFMIEQARRNLL